MNETPTENDKDTGRMCVCVREVQSLEGVQTSLDSGQRGISSVVSITNEIGQRCNKESSSKDDKRSLDSISSTHTKGHSSCSNGSSTFDRHSFVATIRNIKNAGWKTKISTILALPFLTLVWIYRTFISPITPSTCIYTPTCSQYAATAISKHGLKGVWMSIKRVARCRPGMLGGHDPVP